MHFQLFKGLTHWARGTHICVSNLTIIGSDNGLSSGWRQAIIWTSSGVLIVGPLGTDFSEVLIGIHTFSFKKMHLKMLSVKWSPSCLSLNVLRKAANWPWHIEQHFGVFKQHPCHLLTENLFKTRLSIPGGQVCVSSLYHQSCCYCWLILL